MLTPEFCPYPHPTGATPCLWLATSSDALLISCFVVLHVLLGGSGPCGVTLGLAPPSNQVP